ncbi:MAG: hypothetical protein AAF750_04015 [Planctomycetota bacterium]
MLDSSPDKKPAGLVCSTCGYDLRSQALSDECPECGATVMKSVRDSKARQIACRYFRNATRMVWIVAVTNVVCIGLFVFGALPADLFELFLGWYFFLTMSALVAIPVGFFYGIRYQMALTGVSFVAGVLVFLSPWLILVFVLAQL